MICVSKEEAKILRKSNKKIHIIRTCKQKSKRGKFYVEQTNLVKGLLQDFNKNLKGFESDIIWED